MRPELKKMVCIYLNVTSILSKNCDIKYSVNLLYYAASGTSVKTELQPIG